MRDYNISVSMSVRELYRNRCLRRVQVDTPTTPTIHPSIRHKRLAAVAKDIRTCLSHIGQSMYKQRYTEHVQLFRALWFWRTRRFRSQTLAARGIIYFNYNAFINTWSWHYALNVERLLFNMLVTLIYYNN
jgi:hypothetical protein